MKISLTRIIRREIARYLVDMITHLSTELFLAELDVDKARRVKESWMELDKIRRNTKDPDRKAELQSALNKIDDYYLTLYNEVDRTSMTNRTSEIKIALGRVLKRLKEAAK